VLLIRFVLISFWPEKILVRNVVVCDALLVQVFLIVKLSADCRHQTVTLLDKGSNISQERGESL